MATSTSAPSLRVLILVSLGTLVVLAFLPLFFAVANIARAIEHEAATPNVAAVMVTDTRTKKVIATSGSIPFEWSHPEAAPTPLDIERDDGTTHVRLRLRPVLGGEHTDPLLRLIALYIFLFGAVLLAFAYLSLTRLIVRPIDELSREAERVAQGARKFRPPPRGAREVAELGASVRTMTDALVASESSLKKKVDELTLARAELVASERLAGVGRLAAGVAHEIGNPISAMLGMLDIIADETTSEEDRKDLLARTQKETERVSKIVKDLLDFARPDKNRENDASIDSGDSKSSLTMAAATVESAVRDVMSLVSAQRDLKSISVTSDIAPGLVVELAEARLEQVLLNLLLNSAHALKNVQNASISIKAIQREDRVVIVVEDNGPGIPKSARPQIFEPFFTTKDIGEGTGLGLSVCRGLVEAVGGTITLDESFTSGARFRITLPSA